MNRMHDLAPAMATVLGRRLVRFAASRTRYVHHKPPFRPFQAIIARRSTARKCRRKESLGINPAGPRRADPPRTMPERDWRYPSPGDRIANGSRSEKDVRFGLAFGAVCCGSGVFLDGMPTSLARFGTDSSLVSASLPASCRHGNSQHARPAWSAPIRLVDPNGSAGTLDDPRGRTRKGEDDGDASPYRVAPRGGGGLRAGCGCRW